MVPADVLRRRSAVEGESARSTGTETPEPVLVAVQVALQRTTDDAVGPPRSALGVLALQRTAGNHAVAQLLRPGAAVLQRDRKVADDADTLAELGPVLKDIVIDEDTVSAAGRAWYFKNPRLPARAGISVDVRFGGPMAAKDTSKEKSLQAGLGSLAMGMFGLAGDPPKPKKGEDWGVLEPEQPKGTAPRKPRPPVADMTRMVDMDLTDYGGKDGRYRFTAVAAKGTGAKPTDVILIVELIGARRAAFKDWAALDSTRKASLQSRFQRFGFTKRMPREAGPLDAPDLTMPWLDDSWGKVLQALELVPEEMLAGVADIAWERGRGAKSPKGEAGLYETTTGLPQGHARDRRLTIYDDAFKSDDALIRVVAHEVGHAIDFKPKEPAGGKELSAGLDDYRKAATADGVAITTYGKTDWHENYAEAYAMFIAEPATMKVLRPNVHAWFTKQQTDARQAKPPAKTPTPKPVPAGKP